jgi:hypothetical protein
LSILTLNVNRLNSPIKRHHSANWIKKEDPTICCLQETHLIDRKKHWLRVKGWKKIYQANGHQNRAGIAILILDKPTPIDQMDLANVYRILYSTSAQYIFFSSAHETFSKIDHILGHKASLSKHKKI